MTTPFQKISGKLVKAKIFRNEAVLTYVINDYNWQSGENINIKLNRTVNCYPPEPVNANLVDGKNYLSGDQIMRIPFTEIESSRNPLQDDPDIVVNSVKKQLADMRPFDPQTGGILTGVDTITFSGKVYRIGAIRADQWMENQPADYYLTLRT